MRIFILALVLLTACSLPNNNLNKDKFENYFTPEQFDVIKKGVLTLDSIVSVKYDSKNIELSYNLLLNELISGDFDLEQLYSQMDSKRLKTRPSACSVR